MLTLLNFRKCVPLSADLGLSLFYGLTEFYGLTDVRNT